MRFFADADLDVEDGDNAKIFRQRPTVHFKIAICKEDSDVADYPAMSFFFVC